MLKLFLKMLNIINLRSMELKRKDCFVFEAECNFNLIYQNQMQWTTTILGIRQARKEQANG